MDNNINNPDDNNPEDQLGEEVDDISSETATDEEEDFTNIDDLVDDLVDDDSSTDSIYNSEDENKKKKTNFSWKNFSAIKILNSLKDFWINLERRKKIFSISISVAVILFAILIAILLNANSSENQYVTILSGLDGQESREIMAILENMNIKPQLNQFNEIEVKEKDANQAVMNLSLQGYPKKGLFYETAAANSLIATSAEIEQNYLQNKQNRLEATIKTLAGIDQAYVTLTPATNSNKLWNKDIDPSKAQVVIHLNQDYILPYEAVEGIERLVLNSLSDLTRENVTIIDGQGVELNSATYNKNNEKAVMLSDLKIQYERDMEYLVESKLIAVLESAYGQGNANVIVSCTYDFNSFIQETIRYAGANLNEDTNEQTGMVSRDEIDRYISSGSDSSVIGAAGTPLNDDDPGYYEALTDVEDNAYGDDYRRVRDYLIDQVVERLERETPEINALSVGVFINKLEMESEEQEMLIDFVAKSTVVQDLALRSATEDTVLDVDYYRNYISVAAIQFPALGASGTETSRNLLEELLETYTISQLLIPVGILLILIVLTVVIAVMARKAKVRREEKELLRALAIEDTVDFTPSNIAELGKAAAKYTMADEQPSSEQQPQQARPSESKEQLLKKQIRMFTDQNPDISAQLIRTLLKGEEGNSNG